VDELKEFVMKLRQEATEQQLQRQQGLGSSDESRFADVLLRQNRCDLKIPIGYNNTAVTPVVSGLYHALCQSPISETMTQMFRHSDDTTTTEDAVLYELSCLISDYGSHRQVIHPDNPFRTTGSTSTPTSDTTVPTLLTCFIALQDIVNVDMGPTIFLPRTHTQHAHELFAQDTIPQTTSGINATNTTDQLLSPKDTLLRDSPTVMGTLNKGYVCFVCSVKHMLFTTCLTSSNFHVRLTYTNFARSFQI
jgi:hypothetical protein